MTRTREQKRQHTFKLMILWLAPTTSTELCSELPIPLPRTSYVEPSLWWSTPAPCFRNPGIQIRLRFRLSAAVVRDQNFIFLSFSWKHLFPTVKSYNYSWNQFIQQLSIIYMNIVLKTAVTHHCLITVAPDLYLSLVSENMAHPSTSSW